MAVSPEAASAAVAPRAYTLSVVMIVKNEAANLRRLLPLVAPVADEIILLDSGSSDDGQAVAQQYGAQWHVASDWQGFGIQRQRAQALSRGDWILVLDGDESPDAALLEAIARVKTQAPGDTVYGIRRIDEVFGHLIDYPRRGIKAHWRLYPRRFGYCDSAVHESLQLQGAQTQVLPGFLRHHTAATPHFWLEKRLSYAMAWARDRMQGRRVGVASVLLHTFWAFIKQYFVDRRFLCGRYGWIYAWLFAQYTFHKYALLNDVQRRPQGYAPDFEPHAINRHHLPPPPTAPVADAARPYRLSVVLIVCNEAKHLPACLASIADLAHEIVILDSGSTDESERIARHFGAQWHTSADWPGFGVQRQRAQALASGDYVLVIDADEQPDATLKNAIRQVLASAPDARRVYNIRRRNIFCGSVVHAWYTDGLVRLYPREHFQYHPYDVHESLDSRDAAVVTLPGRLDHYTNDNLYHFLQKNLRYSHTWAQEKAAQGKRAPSLWLLPLKSAFAFFREYIIRGAFWGGRYGLYLAISTAGYHFNKYLMLHWAREQAERTPNDPNPS
ncbi:glycosyltransferase family 2 protein [Allofranklinella schreckenbergeri]|nr:glycosyltransferase family 2 protein [Allofranklinella schreckenbergeri]